MLRIGRGQYSDERKRALPLGLEKSSKERRTHGKYSEDRNV